MKTMILNRCWGEGHGRLTRRRRPLLFHGAIAMLLLTALNHPLTAHAQPGGLGGQRDVTVMTRNVYVGAVFDAIIGLDPSDPMYLPKLVQAVTETYYTLVVQNDFRVRVLGIAEEIAANQPDLVGLQEICLLRIQSPGDLVVGGATPASDVVVDYVEVLQQALAERGARYAMVAIVTNWDVELPALNLQNGQIDDVRLTLHDVILARTDLPPGYLRLSNAQAGNFEHRLVLPGLDLDLKRGWCSVDTFIRGRTLRFINAHLDEEIFPELQWLQAQEVLAGPATVPGPVILVGDFNSDANHQNGTVTYDGLVAAGFTDVWSVVHPGYPGLTWGHDPFLADPTTSFVWRLDLVLFRHGNFDPVEARILDAPLLRSQPPLWSSDHAGVVARLRLN